jgi:geranylgeranyl diphosphate synthase, type II
MESARRSPQAEAGAPGEAPSLEARRRAIEQALDRALPPPSAWPKTIHEAIRYSLFAGGKRIRPLLALAAAEAAGAEDDDDVLPFACAVEMVHTYSLIHDDLPAMDDDDLRRGKPTCHKVYGEAIAILAGDALLTRAFHLIVDLPADPDADRVRRRLQAAAILGEACGTTGLIGGQVLDLESEGRAVDDATLERLHRAKTGALLAACVRGGAVLGRASGATLSCLDRYASAIGLAFQVVDDVLDATEGAERLGKTAGKDSAAGKATYVAVHGLDGARRIAAELLNEAREALAPLGRRGAMLDALARLIVERRA